LFYNIVMTIGIFNQTKIETIYFFIEPELKENFWQDLVAFLGTNPSIAAVIITPATPATLNNEVYYKLQGLSLITPRLKILTTVANLPQLINPLLKIAFPKTEFLVFTLYPFPGEKIKTALKKLSAATLGLARCYDDQGQIRSTVWTRAAWQKFSSTSLSQQILNQAPLIFAQQLGPALIFDLTGKGKKQLGRFFFDFRAKLKKFNILRKEISLFPIIKIKNIISPRFLLLFFYFALIIFALRQIPFLQQALREQSRIFNFAPVLTTINKKIFPPPSPTPTLIPPSPSPTPSPIPNDPCNLPLAEINPQELPQKIKIPSLELELPVIAVPLINGTWEVYDYTANFAQGTALPNGKKGNTGIYGHDRPQAFAALKKLSGGESVVVETKNYLFYYQISEIKKQLRPEEVDIFYPTNKPVLTLLTCNGTFSQHRYALRANLIRIAKKNECPAH